MKEGVFFFLPSVIPWKGNRQGLGDRPRAERLTPSSHAPTARSCGRTETPQHTTLGLEASGLQCPWLAPSAVLGAAPEPSVWSLGPHRGCVLLLIGRRWGQLPSGVSGHPLNGPRATRGGMCVPWTAIVLRVILVSVLTLTILLLPTRKRARTG